MRVLVAILALLGCLAAGCAETQRCPDAEVFDEGGRCRPIPDAGDPDAGDGG